jgi:hypothetical protein
MTAVDLYCYAGLIILTLFVCVGPYYLEGPDLE